MLAHKINLTDRAAYEYYDAYEARLELYRVTPEWFYIVVALSPFYPEGNGAHLSQR